MSEKVKKDVIYVDVEDQTTNVIYRREDGEIGLLEVKES